MNPTDQQLATLFRDASSDLPTDVTELVAGGIARGRSRRRRQGVGTALAAVAVIGVIGVAVSVAPGLLGEDAAPDRGGVPMATESSSTSPAPKTVVPERLRPLPSAEISALFRSVHPGEVADVQPLEDGKDTQIAHFRWDGYFTSVIVSAGSGSPMSQCRAMTGPEMECVAQPDQTVTLQWQQTADGVTGRGFSVFGEHGEVALISYNASEGKDAETLSDEPPFDYAELEQAARADGWWVSAS